MRIPVGIRHIRLRVNIELTSGIHCTALDGRNGRTRTMRPRMGERAAILKAGNLLELDTVRCPRDSSLRHIQVTQYVSVFFDVLKSDDILGFIA